MTTATLTPIPWGFLDHAYMKAWIWRTDHFEAKVHAEGNSFSWEVIDYIRSPDGIHLASNRTGTFADAETAVRETIGKSYPPRYGYAHYAGHLAATFLIATGEHHDFTPHISRRTVITVKLPNGTEQSYTGTLKVSHYELHLTPDSGATLAIQPSHITRIHGEGPTRTPAASTHTGMGRTHTGARTPGCTGTPGFMPNTVDHNGPHCPVHEG